VFGIISHAAFYSVDLLLCCVLSSSQHYAYYMIVLQSCLSPTYFVFTFSLFFLFISTTAISKTVYLCLTRCFSIIFFLVMPFPFQNNLATVDDEVTVLLMLLLLLLRRKHNYWYCHFKKKRDFLEELLPSNISAVSTERIRYLLFITSYSSSLAIISLS